MAYNLHNFNKVKTRREERMSPEKFLEISLGSRGLIGGVEIEEAWIYIVTSLSIYPKNQRSNTLS